MMNQLKSPELTNDFGLTVQNLANRVYEEFAKTNPELLDSPWSAPYCYDIASRLQTQLADELIFAQLIEGGGDFDDIHTYLETDDGLIIDPTWQQFIDPDAVNENTPRVLIVHRDALEPALTSYKIPNIVQTLWGVPEKDGWYF